ncbi:MAG: hypothetical protein KC503_29765 [Myxococcales bacterium]|nr:hypothetical protein [Myxococcales bacterium]
MSCWSRSAARHTVVAALALLAVTSGCADGGLDTAVPLSAEHVQRAISHRLADAPPPPDPTNRVADDPAAARLGQFLFFDKRLSGDGRFSCASCHDPSKGFGDDRALGEATGKLGRHTPSIYNTVYNRWFFWDGRADSHWSQALAPLEHPDEQAGDRLAFAHLVASDAPLRAAYEAIFGALPDLSDSARFPARGRPAPDDPGGALDTAWRGMSAADQKAIDTIFVNLAKAIAAYERLIVARDAPFDRFAAGLEDGDANKLAALSASAQRGLRLFMGRANCWLCHTGPNFTDREFHNIATPERPGVDPLDQGRFVGVDLVKGSPFNAASSFSDAPDGDAAKRLAFIIATEEHVGAFKTPSLRNIEKTAPYMHGGHYATLEDVIGHYSLLISPSSVGHREETLIPLALDADETADLISFLKSLSGKPLAADLLSAPTSPSL